MDSVSFDDIQQYLRKLRQELLIPKLSVVKVSSLLHHTVLAKTGNKQLADLITGIDANQSSSVSIVIRIFHDYMHNMLIF